jgi:hypothetical protein
MSSFLILFYHGVVVWYGELCSAVIPLVPWCVYAAEAEHPTIIPCRSRNKSCSDSHRWWRGALATQEPSPFPSFLGKTWFSFGEGICPLHSYPRRHLLLIPEPVWTHSSPEGKLHGAQQRRKERRFYSTSYTSPAPVGISGE